MGDKMSIGIMDDIERGALPDPWVSVVGFGNGFDERELLILFVHSECSFVGIASDKELVLRMYLEVDAEVILLFHISAKFERSCRSRWPSNVYRPRANFAVDKNSSPSSR